jgi:hypothetical protein
VVAPADPNLWLFSAGEASANYLAEGKDYPCKTGTLHFDENSVQVDVNARGDVVPGHLSVATFTGTSTCKDKPFVLSEKFHVISGSLIGRAVDEILGQSSDEESHGGFVMSGFTCYATIHLAQFNVLSRGGRIQVDGMIFTKVKSQNCSIRF